MAKYTVKNPDGTILGETEIGGTVENITMRNVNQTATLHIEPDNGYNWQGDFEVTGADASASPLEGVLYLSNPVSDISVNIIYKKNVYTITSTGNHCTVSGDTTIEFEGTANLRITADTGYRLPNNVTVSGANSNYDKSTGIIVLYNPTGNVTVTVTATPISYAIINKLTNCTSRSGNPTTIKRDSSATLNYDLSAGYVFPNVINVVNASYTWDNNGGLALSNPTGIVTVTIVCPAQDYTINYNTVNCDWDGAQNISVEAAAVATLTPHEGYKLPDSITVTNCTYTYDKSTGVVQMANPIGNVTVICTAVKITYSITTNVTYGTYTGDTTIEYGGLANVTITANNGYKLPGTITVTGATYTFSNGVVYLSSPTNNVTITCVCVEDTPSTGETWVLNETIINALAQTNVNFKAKNSTTNYTGIRFAEAFDSYNGYYYYVGGYWLAYETSWHNQNDRTITFETAPTGDLLTWLQANGTKQGGATLINFTINGTSYQAEEGMTWQQWVDSSYNTGAFIIESSYVAVQSVSSVGGYKYVAYNSTYESPQNVIVQDRSYALLVAGGGN